MPWSQTRLWTRRPSSSPITCVRRFSFTELCARYGVSRETGYRVDRALPEARTCRTRDTIAKTAQAVRTQTAAHIVEALLEATSPTPALGREEAARRCWRKRHPRWDLPGRTTVFEILNRHGMVPKKRRRGRSAIRAGRRAESSRPNELWCADFKGEFKTGDGDLLLSVDRHRRLTAGICWAAKGCCSTKVIEAKPVFTRLFKEYGLPKRIRTDNGVPFATNTLARLSRLSAWWVRLGVLPELIEPGKPQQNGRHERMHRTLKAETTRPPAGSLPRAAAQVQLLPCRSSTTSARTRRWTCTPRPRCYESSTREMPNKLPPLEYPDRSRCVM